MSTLTKLYARDLVTFELLDKEATDILSKHYQITTSDLARFFSTYSGSPTGTYMVGIIRSKRLLKDPPFEEGDATEEDAN